MGLWDALENFVDNLPTAMDGLRDLRREFRETFEPLAKEGAELFTLGFAEMVIKDNNDWKSSVENRAEAREVVLQARAAHPDLTERREQALVALNVGLEALESGRRECWEGLAELKGVARELKKVTTAAGSVTPGMLIWPTLIPQILNELRKEEAEERAAQAAEPFGCELSSFPPDPAITVEEYQARLSEATLARMLGAKPHLEAKEEDEEKSADFWYGRIKEEHRHSAAELEKAQALAKEPETIRAYVTTECEQIETLTGVAFQAGALFKEAGRHFMAAASRLEGRQGEEPEGTEPEPHLTQLCGIFCRLLNTELLPNNEIQVGPEFQGRLNEARKALEESRR